MMCIVGGKEGAGRGFLGDVRLLPAALFCVCERVDGWVARGLSAIVCR